MRLGCHRRRPAGLGVARPHPPGGEEEAAESARSPARRRQGTASLRAAMRSGMSGMRSTAQAPGVKAGLRARIFLLAAMTRQPYSHLEVIPVRIESHGIEPIPAAERHGRSSSLFTLWFAANLGIPPWFLGVLLYSFGLGLWASLATVVVANLIGAALVAAASSMGPGSGLPQLALSRSGFGRIGVYVPAALNWLSCLGWFAVNSVLGGELLASLIGVPSAAGIVLIGVVQIAIAVFGHDVVHFVERWVAVLLALTFAYFTWRSVVLGAGAPALQQGAFHWAPFALGVAMIASYVFSWAPYASDYSRYLPASAGRRGAFGWTFLGNLLACAWVEVLGVLLAAHFRVYDAVPLLRAASGGLAVFVFAAGIFGTLTADLLNIYTGATSLLALGIRAPRALAAVIVGVLGTALALLGMRGFSGDYESFLLLLSYWIAPWLGVLFMQRAAARAPRALEAGFWAFLIGLVLSVPFMSQSLFTGPAARAMGGADVAYYVGGIAAAVIYLLLRPRSPAVREPAGLGPA